MKLSIILTLIFLIYIPCERINAQQQTAGFKVVNREIESELKNIDILMENEETSKALDNILKLYQKYPKNPKVISKYETILIETGNEKKLINLYQKQILNYPNMSLYYFKLSEIYYNNSNIESAETILDSLLAVYNYQNQIIKKVIDKYISWGETEKTIDLIKKTRKIKNDEFLFSFELANIYDLEGMENEMLDEYLFFLSTQPNRSYNSSQRTFIIENLENKAQDNPQIIQKIEKKLSDFDHHNAIQKLIGQLYFKIGNYDKASKIYISLDKKIGANGMMIKELSNLCIKEKKYDIAIEIIRSAKKLYNTDISYEIASFFYESGNIDSAIHYYTQAISSNIQPNLKYKISYQLATIYLYNKHDLKNSLKYIQMIDETKLKNKSKGELLLLKAVTLLKQGKFNESEALFNQMGQKTNEYNINPGDLIYYLSKIYFYQKLFLKSSQMNQVILKQFPTSQFYNDVINEKSILKHIKTDMPLLNSYSEIKWQIESFRFSDAEKNIKEFIIQNPDFPEIQKIYLILIDILKTTNKEQLMLQYLTQGIKKAPDSFDGMRLNFELAKLYEKQEKYNEAYKIYQLILRSPNGIALKPIVRERINSMKSEGMIHL